MNAAEEKTVLSDKPMTLSASGHRALALALFLLAALIALASGLVGPSGASAKTLGTPQNRVWQNSARVLKLHPIQTPQSSDAALGVGVAGRLDFSGLFGRTAQSIAVSGEAHIPVTGSQWYDYYASQYGAENVGWSRLPEFTGPKSTGGTGTIGVLRTYSGDFDVLSGRLGPASTMSGNGFDIVSRMHAEGQAAAIMRILGDSEGVLYLNNPQICSSCLTNLNRMVPPGGSLNVVLPDGTSIPFSGSLP